MTGGRLASHSQRGRRRNRQNSKGAGGVRNVTKEIRAMGKKERQTRSGLPYAPGGTVSYVNRGGGRLPREQMWNWSLGKSKTPVDRRENSIVGARQRPKVNRVVVGLRGNDEPRDSSLA